jgi:DNA primase
MLDKIVEACRHLLKNYHGAQACKSYLDSRLNEKSQEEFQFGYFPGVQELSVLTDLVGEDVLRQEKLFYTREIEDSLFPRSIGTCYFEDYPLILPFKNTYGKPVGLVGRTILEEKEYKAKNLSKYKNTATSDIFVKGNNLFGLYEAKQAILDQGCVYIVEGQFDVIKAREIGFHNIVALGNNTMTSYQLSVISRYSNNIFLLLDNDEAGQKGRKLIVSKFSKFANIRHFYLPDDYKDIDEYLTKTQIGSYEEVSFVVKD